MNCNGYSTIFDCICNYRITNIRKIMNKEESLALYEKGRDAWNAWANDMLAKKAELEKDGQWQIDADGQGINPETKKWIDESRVDFSGYTFEEKSNFTSFIFPDFVDFTRTIFRAEARFHATKFEGKAFFHYARFKNVALFIEVIFSSGVWFNSTRFSEEAAFFGTTFSDHANFYKTIFKGLAVFNRATFKGTFSFIDIEEQSYFLFRKTIFHLVPDFSQTHFTEAPQFDDADFSIAKSHNQSKNESDLSSRWRALKRLAIQGHDHERELFFLAEEIKSQRGIQDKALPHPIDYINNNKNDVLWPGGARYWLGYLYEYLSDFGRSVMRPIFWLLLLGFMFQFFYLKYPIDPKPQEPILCNQSEAATYLSVRSALPFLPATSYSENLSRSYTCLYGKNNDGKENIPNAIVFLSIFQTMLSSILIFLILLALRNHFRIK